MGLDDVSKLDAENNKPRYKNKLKKKGEDTVYGELRKKFPDGKAFGIMTLKEYVEQLKAELQQEEQQQDDNK